MFLSCGVNHLQKSHTGFESFTSSYIQYHALNSVAIFQQFSVLPTEEWQTFDCLEEIVSMDSFLVQCFTELHWVPFCLSMVLWLQDLICPHTELMFINSFAHKLQFNLSQTCPCLQFKSFENTVEIGKNAHKEQFLLFPQGFLPFWRTFYHFHHFWNCRLQILSVLKSLKLVI